MILQQQHGCLVAAFLVCTAAATLAVSAEAGEVRIWPTAVVTGDEVTLADVADLREFDLPTKHKLSGIVVHAAPRAGGEVLVRIADIRGALSEAEANLAAIKLFGSARCKVSKPRPPRKPRHVVKRQPRRRAQPARRKEARPEPAEAQAETLEVVLRRLITARVTDPDATVEIRFGPASERMLQLRTDEHRFKIHPASDRRLGLLSFEVDIIRRGHPVRTAPLVAEVQLVKEVVVARRPINRGRIVEGRDLRIEERRFTDLASIGITDLAAALGQRSGHFLRQGDMLRAELLEAKPLVRRGERVIIWARVGGVEIKTTGKAQSAGALGEAIEVCRDGARRKRDMFEAIVTGPKTVTVADARQFVSR